MSCSMTKYGAGSGDRIQELSIQSPMLYHYATVLHWLQLVPNVGEKIISKRLYFFFISLRILLISLLFILDPFIRLMKVLNKSLINLLISIIAQNDHCIGILSMSKHRHANNTPGGDSLPSR